MECKNAVSMKLSDHHIEYLNYLMSQHCDFNFSRMVRKVLDGGMYLLNADIDITDKSDVIKVVQGIRGR